VSITDFVDVAADNRPGIKYYLALPRLWNSAFRVAPMTLTRFLIVLALSFSCAVLHSVSGQTVSPSTPQTKPTKVPGATVSGRITVQGKGKGGVFVGIRAGEFSPQTAPAIKTVTDADGNYHLPDIPPGTYRVLPIAPAYVVSDYTAFGGQGKGLILNEGERVDGIDFSIVRGAIVTGKITQSDGTPVIDEPVYLVAAEQRNQRGASFTGSSRFLTDDRGVYRMFGIAPGRYKVCIGVPDDAYFPNRNRPTFVRVFYPSVVEFNEAKVVELSEGSEASDIDITVGQSMQNFAASGIIVDSDSSQPIQSVRLGLQRVIDPNMGPFISSSAISNARGEFRLENITPGKYLIIMMPQPNSDFRVAPIGFEIVDQDVTGLVLKTVKGGVVSGFVLLEGKQDRELYARLAKLRLLAYVRGSREGAQAGLGSVSAIAADGGFRFGGLPPGAATFNLSSPDPQIRSGFVISRIERDGMVQPRTGVDIKEGEVIAGLRIVVVYGTGIVRGSVKLDNGPPPSGTNLMVRLIKTGDSSFSIRPQNADARGYFVFDGVPSGTYEVNVIGFIPQLRGRQPTVKQSVTVTDGIATEVHLVINTDPETPPAP